MLHKHLKSFEPGLDKLSVRDLEDVLCDSVFENEAAYGELIRSSEGNPRDFLRLLGKCANSVQTESDKRITERMVFDAAISYFQEDKQPEIADRTAVIIAFEELFKLVTSKSCKVFAVSSAIGEKSDALRELWHYRFLHLVQERVPLYSKGDLKEYDVYAMDYGKLLSLKLSREGEKNLGMIESAAVTLLGKLIGTTILLGPLISLALRNEKIGRPLRTKLARLTVRDVERSRFDSIDELVAEGCVADDILLPPKPKRASQAGHKQRKP
jgi:hypothetical protein